MQPAHLAALWPPCPTCAKATSQRPPPRAHDGAKRIGTVGTIILATQGLPQQRVGQRSLWPEIVTSTRPKRQAGAPKSRPAWRFIRDATAITNTTRGVSRALELLAHRKVESLKSVGSSYFLLVTLPTEPVLNAQLASLVGKGAGRRGEIAGDLDHPQGDRGRKRVNKVTVGHRSLSTCTDHTSKHTRRIHRGRLDFGGGGNPHHPDAHHTVLPVGTVGTHAPAEARVERQHRWRAQAILSAAPHARRRPVIARVVGSRVARAVHGGDLADELAGFVVPQPGIEAGGRVAVEVGIDERHAARRHLEGHAVGISLEVARPVSTGEEVAHEDGTLKMVHRLGGWHASWSGWHVKLGVNALAHAAAQQGPLERMHRQLRLRGIGLEGGEVDAILHAHMLGMLHQQGRLARQLVLVEQARIIVAARQAALVRDGSARRVALVQKGARAAPADLLRRVLEVDHGLLGLAPPRLHEVGARAVRRSRVDLARRAQALPRDRPASLGGPGDVRIQGADQHGRQSHGRRLLDRLREAAREAGERVPVLAAVDQIRHLHSLDPAKKRLDLHALVSWPLVWIELDPGVRAVGEQPTRAQRWQPPPRGDVMVMVDLVVWDAALGRALPPHNVNLPAHNAHGLAAEA
eukprot:scaffold13116_cov62-Phaeocystis_antarctica.AAC.3